MLFAQVWPAAHGPQENTPPQPSERVPQLCGDGHVVFLVHPHTSGVPPPPHVAGGAQLPQLIVPPQPSGAVPQP
jgi:hypothetical protein